MRALLVSMGSRQAFSMMLDMLNACELDICTVIYRVGRELVMKSLHTLLKHRPCEVAQQAAHY